MSKVRKSGSATIQVSYITWRSNSFAVALAQTDARKVTSREKLCEKIDLESLTQRRYIGTDALIFYTTVNSISPDYPRYPKLRLIKVLSSHRRANTSEHIKEGTMRFKGIVGN